MKSSQQHAAASSAMATPEHPNLGMQETFDSWWVVIVWHRPCGSHGAGDSPMLCSRYHNDDVVGLSFEANSGVLANVYCFSACLCCTVFSTGDRSMRLLFARLHCCEQVKWPANVLLQLSSVILLESTAPKILCLFPHLPGRESLPRWQRLICLQWARHSRLSMPH